MALENKKSNRFNLKTCIVMNAFNAESTHSIKIEINKNVFFEVALTKDKEHTLEILDYIDYGEPGLNNMEITWNGKRECAKKFIKIKQITVNDQHIAPHSVMMTPFPNEYINDLLSTQKGKTFYRKKIFNPGHEHGWYGRYRFKFLLDANEIKKNNEGSVLDSTGIRAERIYSDSKRQKFFRMVSKNED